MSEQNKMDAERARFDAAVQAHLRQNPDDWQLTGGHDDEGQWAFVGWKLALASLPVGVPDGYAIVPVEPTPEIRQAIDLLCDDHRAFDDSEAFWQYLLDSAPAAPTVKAEPAQCTNEDSWNCKYCRKTQTCEALADKRNFGAPAPSLTAAGSAGKELEWARHGLSEAIELIDCISRHPTNRIPVLDQARAVLVKALSAQQSAPERVSVPSLADVDRYRIELLPEHDAGYVARAYVEESEPVAEASGFNAVEAVKEVIRLINAKEHPQ